MWNANEFEGLPAAAAPLLFCLRSLMTAYRRLRWMLQSQKQGLSYDSRNTNDTPRKSCRICGNFSSCIVNIIVLFFDYMIVPSFLTWCSRRNAEIGLKKKSVSVVIDFLQCCFMGREWKVIARNQCSIYVCTFSQQIWLWCLTVVVSP